MPMVFSATALSMPALVASRPTSSSIFAPSPTTGMDRSPLVNLILIACDVKYKRPTPNGMILIRRVLQQCKTWCRFTLTCCAAFPIFSLNGRKKVSEAAHTEVGEYSCVRRERFQSVGRMRYDCHPNLPMRAKRRCDGDFR